MPMVPRGQWLRREDRDHHRRLLRRDSDSATEAGAVQTGVRSNGCCASSRTAARYSMGDDGGGGRRRAANRSRKQDLCFRLTERRWVRAIDLAEQVRAASSWTG